MMRGSVILWLLVGTSTLALSGVALSAPPSEDSARSAAGQAGGGQPPSEAEAFFENKVRPVLFQRCFSCHGEKEPKSGLRLDSRAAILKGGVRGAAVVPGKPEESLLLKVLTHTGDVK